MGFTDYQTVAEICRQRAGLADASMNARFLWVIPQALTQFARKTAANENRRHHLMTDKTAVTGTTDADGLLDLSTLISDEGVLLEFLRYGSIYTTQSSYPAQPTTREAAQFIPLSNLGAEYVFYYLEGTNLYLINADGTPLGTETVSFAVPFVPTVSQIPAQMEDEFLDKVIELASSEPDDAAEDGAK